MRAIKSNSQRYSTLDEIVLLAKLHDTGKIAIDKNILMKPGKLSNDEWDEIKKHPEIGYRIVKSIDELSHIAEGILAHHEYWNGKGYPKGLKEDAIPISARIVSLIDAYDVMTHERPYKKAMSREEAIKEIKNCSGTQFDPEIVEIFTNIMALSHIVWI